MQVWIERAPSESKSADWPSQQETAEAAALIGRTCGGDLEFPGEVMARLLNFQTLENCAKAFASNQVESHGVKASDFSEGIAGSDMICFDF